MALGYCCSMIVYDVSAFTIVKLIMQLTHGQYGLCKMLKHKFIGQQSPLHPSLQYLVEQLVEFKSNIIVSVI